MFNSYISCFIRLGITFKISSNMFNATSWTLSKFIACCKRWDVNEWSVFGNGILQRASDRNTFSIAP